MPTAKKPNIPGISFNLRTDPYEYAVASGGR